MVGLRTNTTMQLELIIKTKTMIDAKIVIIRRILGYRDVPNSNKGVNYSHNCMKLSLWLN